MGSDITPMTTCDYPKFGLNLRKRPADAGIDHSYAENAMKEVLQWYGYDGRHQTETERLVPKTICADTLPKLDPVQLSKKDLVNAVQDVIKPQNTIEQHQVEESLTVIVKQEILEENATEEQTDDPAWNSQVLIKQENLSSEIEDCKECSWCGKSLMFHDGGVSAGAGARYCSETCFAQSRRASFKRAKVCDWCRHIRHTISHEDYQGAGSGLQFCSDKCLNQYKMHIFCHETKAQLEQHPHLRASMEQSASTSSSSSKKDEGLITPELWLNDCRESTTSSNEDTAKSFTSCSLGSKPNQNQETARRQIKNSRTTKSSVIQRANNGSSNLASSPTAQSRQTDGKNAENGQRSKHNDSKRRKYTVINNIPANEVSLNRMTPGFNNRPSGPVANYLNSFATSLNPATRYASATMCGAGAETIRIPTNYNVPQVMTAQHSKGPHHQRTTQQQQMTPPNQPRYSMFVPRAGPPPITVLVPYPVVIPVPMPIPIPIPLPFEKFVKAYGQDKSTSTSDETKDESPSNNEVQNGPLDCTIKKINHDKKDDEIQTISQQTSICETLLANIEGRIQKLSEEANNLQRKSRKRRRLHK